MTPIIMNKVPQILKLILDKVISSFTIEFTYFPSIRTVATVTSPDALRIADTKETGPRDIAQTEAIKAT